MWAFVNAMLTNRIANRNWLQWSLRSLLVIILLFAAAFAWYGSKLRKEARIKNAIRLVAASPTLFGGDHDLIALVRAVNALHALGKDEAIEVLRQVAAQNSALAHNSPLLFINQLLFDHADPEDDFFWTDETPERKAVWSNTYCSNCLAVAQDLPFKRDTGFAWGTLPEYNLLPVLDWAENSGRLRTNPLRLADDPIDATDKLTERLQNSWFTKEIPNHNTRLLREQAFRSISHLLSDEGSGGKLTPENDDDWNRIKEQAKKMGIKWSELQQAYVATNLP
jgi:hypothetical protein